MFDLVVRGGTIVDGSGAAGYLADVGVAGETIAAIGDLSRAEAGRVIDATGLAVARASSTRTPTPRALCSSSPRTRWGCGRGSPLCSSGSTGCRTRRCRPATTGCSAGGWAACSATPGRPGHELGRGVPPSLPPAGCRQHGVSRAAGHGAASRSWASGTCRCAATRWTRRAVSSARASSRGRWGSPPGRSTTRGRGRTPRS